MFLSNGIGHKMSNHKQWIKLGFQICKLYIQKKNNQKNPITLSYNKISSVYDKKWTDHMNNVSMESFSMELINRIKFPEAGKAIDLTCGTGYVTHLINERFAGEVVGVDLSDDMLKKANEKYGDKCQFVCRDALDFLVDQPSESVDIVTCVWGLGFLKPYMVIKEISRILKPGGQLAIIDLSLFSLYEIVISGVSTIAEYPASVIGIMNGNWLPTKGSLTRRMRMSGLQVVCSWNGKHTYYANNEKTAIDFLLSTGSAAGYRYCIDTHYSGIIKQRFGEIFKKSYGTKQGLPITHRFIAAIAKKPN
jgi:ubiquinone/menaquinone biosynthesis C-methylase UbiE